MILLKLLLAPFAKPALQSRLGARETADVLDQTFRRYAQRRHDVPREQNIGARIMVRLAVLTLAFHDALVMHGLTTEEAAQLTARVAWLVYAKMAVLPRVLAGLSTRDRYRRLKRSTDLFRFFPFSTPGYDMVDVPATRDVVAFDVRRCPVAEYFQSQGSATVCVATFCALDYPLATEWGATLERRCTIAQGADACDFRWRVNPPS